jgi:tetratricopeptide (TPR) repeat protein
MARTFCGFAVMLAVIAAGPSLTAQVSGEPITIETGDDAVPTPQQPEEVQQAATRFKNNDLEGALALLKAAAKKHPELPPPWIIIADWLGQVNNAQGVRNALENAVKEAPDDPNAYAVLGQLNLRSGNWTEAQLLFEAALAKLKTYQGNPTRKTALTRGALGGLATVARARGNWDVAQKHLEALIADDPKNVGAYQELARALFHQDKPDAEVLAQFRKAAELNENVLTPEAQLAQLYQAKGDQKSAQKWMAAAINFAPRDVNTRLAAAQWSLQTGQFQQAAAQADAALQLDADSLAARNLRGVVALYEKDYQTAADFFQKAHIDRPSFFPASNNLALALCELSDPAQKRRALEFAQNNVRQFSNQAEGYSTLAWVLYKLGRVDEAEQALNKCVQVARQAGQNVSADTQYYMARIWADKDRKDDAKQLLQQTLESTQPFSMRPEAEELLEELSK